MAERRIEEEQSGFHYNFLMEKKKSTTIQEDSISNRKHNYSHNTNKNRNQPPLSKRIKRFQEFKNTPGFAGERENRCNRQKLIFFILIYVH